MVNFAGLLLSLVLIASWLPPQANPAPSLPTTPFDEYGAISWEDEKARLDNFAIQVQNDDNLIGYILVFDAVGGCPGEAQARAIRAKRYVVEHRGVAWNRVIWRREGYVEGISTMLQPALRHVSLPHPFLSTVPGKDGALTKPCTIRLDESDEVDGDAAPNNGLQLTAR